MNILTVINHILKIWILVTATCSLISGILFILLGCIYLKNNQKIIALFTEVIYKSFKGALSGSLVGLILGLIIYLIIPLSNGGIFGTYGDKQIAYIITFIISWIVGTFADGINAGNTFLKKYR